jgi:hypothetical protein
LTAKLEKVHSAIDVANDVLIEVPPIQNFDFLRFFIQSADYGDVVIDVLQISYKEENARVVKDDLTLPPFGKA